jgi:hypothetical protein
MQVLIGSSWLFRSSAMDPLKMNLDREFERMDKMFNHLMRSTFQGFR